MECDLLIIGAGPAGCAAAVAARSAGGRLRIAVIDAARFPREKLCGGALTGGALRELEEARLELRVPHVVVRRAQLRAGGRTVRVELPRPAAVVRRIELDADLLDQARPAASTVVEGASLERIEGNVAITTAGPIGFRALVAADGAGGRSRRALHLPSGRRIPLRETVAPEQLQRDLVFDLDAVARGYGWRFPCLDGGRPAETYGVYSVEPDPALDDRLADFAGREGLADGGVGRASIRLFDPRGAFGDGRGLLAGEALGVDPLAGEGLRYALWSGRIAGTVAGCALARGAPLSPSAYRARLVASRSGVLLHLAVHLAQRLYGADPRWRRAALDPAVAGAIAAAVSGSGPVRPVLALLARFPRAASARWRAS